jgi:hypothetical protein
VGSDVEFAVALVRVGRTWKHDSESGSTTQNLEARLSSLTDVVYMKRFVEEVALLGGEATNAACAAETAARNPPA